MLEKRHLVLTVALFLSLWLVWHGRQQELGIEISQPTRVLNTAQLTNPLLTGGSSSQLQLKIRTLPASNENLFSAMHLNILPQTRAVSLKAPEPVAPALPFKYLGRISAGTSDGVMLNVQGEVTPIQKGDILLGQYKVQSIKENLGTLQIQFLYLPLKQIQTLSAQTGN
jgi:hypothetical protein